MESVRHVRNTNNRNFKIEEISALKFLIKTFSGTDSVIDFAQQHP